MIKNVQELSANLDTIRKQLYPLRHQLTQISSSPQRIHFIKTTYLPLLVEYSFQASVLAFELDFPLGGERYEQHYFEAEQDRLHHFFS
ncbi:MAG: hypothetical protein MUE30_17135 [Spirosomaceae bacterium]|jgi:hypothetical protein|nr:hypothetical protein [Spirosomataceae bacterium]